MHKTPHEKKNTTGSRILKQIIVFGQRVIISTWCLYSARFFYWDPEDNIKTKSFSICRENIYEIYLGLKWAAIECKKGRMLASLSYRGAEGNGVYLRLPSSIPTNDIALFTIPGI